MLHRNIRRTAEGTGVVLVLLVLLVTWLRL